MQWCLEQAKKQVEMTYVEAETKVKQELDNEMNHVWETYHRVKKESSNTDNQHDIITNEATATIVSNENVQPNISNSRQADNDATQKLSELKISNSAIPQQISKPEPETTIRIDIMSGPYIGKFFMIKPTIRSACLIGRSTSKKFKEKGMSLPKDGEISTSHGKFEKIDKEFYYIDTGSTNGSRLKESGYEIPSHEPILLPKGNITELIIGASTLQIQIL
jgi:hypothetical protein